MRRLLASWLLFAAVWIPAQSLVAVFVVRRISLTQTAFWSGLLIPLLQAAAVESLRQPFFGPATRARLAELLAAKPVRIAARLFAVAASVVIAGHVQPSMLGPIGVSGASLVTASALFVAAFVLGARALRAASPHVSLLALGALGLAATEAWPRAFERLCEALPEPRAALRLALTALAGAVAVTLLLTTARRAPGPPSILFEIGAGAAVGAALARLVPLSLGIPVAALRELTYQLLVISAAACAAAAALLPPNRAAKVE